MCSKKFCVQAKGGPSPSGRPKYATAPNFHVVMFYVGLLIVRLGFLSDIVLFID